MTGSAGAGALPTPPAEAAGHEVAVRWAGRLLAAYVDHAQGMLVAIKSAAHASLPCKLAVAPPSMLHTHAVMLADHQMCPVDRPPVPQLPAGRAIPPPHIHRC